jgi:hypothetical protein
MVSAVDQGTKEVFYVNGSSSKDAIARPNRNFMLVGIDSPYGGVSPKKNFETNDLGTIVYPGPVPINFWVSPEVSAPYEIKLEPPTELGVSACPQIDVHLQERIRQENRERKAENRQANKRSGQEEQAETITEKGQP